MTTRALAISMCALAAVLVGAAALVLYDRGRGDTIPKGVRIAGVDVGGMKPAAARRVVEQRFGSDVRQPIVVHRHDHVWKLTPAKAKLRLDVDAAVDRAVAKADDGNVLSRSWRRLTGGHVAQTDLQPPLSHSRPAVRAFVRHIGVTLGRSPADATLSFGGTGFQRHRSHMGVRVVSARLTRGIERALSTPSAPHRLGVPIKLVAPKVSTTQLSSKNQTVLVVDRNAFQLKLYKRLKLDKTYSIAVGMVGLDTPAGLYHIQNKQINPPWNVPHSAWTGSLAGQTIPGGAPNNPLKSRWLGIFDGAGIHGIDPSEYGSIGHAASHGCVRMRIEDVEDLYPRVPVGAPIFIH